jgi:hypothetical protein
LKDMVYTSGKMVEHIPVNGKITICMARVSTLGPMVGAMKDSTKWTKNTAMVFTPGQMEEFTKAHG